MATTKMNTRIVLRNDALSAWEKSDRKLLKGEVALAQLSGGNYKMRIGVGSKSWNELSDQGQLIIPVANVEGLEDAIAQLSTSYYETSAIADLSDTYVNGDIAVVTADIDGEHTAYTAYRYSTKTSSWQALDGNYSAENVYFPSDMTLTYAFGRFSVPSSGSYTLSCKGMSVKEMINDAYAKRVGPTVTQPTFSFATSGGNIGTTEVGTTYTPAGATFKMTNDGNYTYGPSPTGVKVAVGGATISANTGAATASNTSIITENGTLTCANGTADQIYLSGGTTYTYKLTYTYSDGDEPKDNLGSLSAAAKIVGKSNQTSSITKTYKGVFPCYFYYSSGASTAPTAVDTTKATKISLGNATIEGKTVSNVATMPAADTWYKLISEEPPTTFYFGAKAYQNFYVVCKGHSSGWTGKKSNNVNAINTVDPTKATVTFTNSATAEYNVLAVTNAQSFSDYAAFMTYK